MTNSALYGLKVANDWDELMAPPQRLFLPALTDNYINSVNWQFPSIRSRFSYHNTCNTLVWYVRCWTQIENSMNLLP